MDRASPSSSSIIFFFFTICRIMFTLGKRPNSLSQELFTLDIANHIFMDNNATKIASKDFGNMIQIRPLAVLYPSSTNDVKNLIKFSYKSTNHFPISARGRGHSIRGQAMSKNGVVVEMSALKTSVLGQKIGVLWDHELGFYTDVCGGELWIDVLMATLEHGLAPVSWTDYLYLSVGGTLSNGGVSGQSFKHGPQISNVHELDVITGKGDLVTCSKHLNSELFYAVLGGLGQFGIITRARIALDKAPQRVKWVRMLYSDFSSFTRDQERLISISGLDYVEGSPIMNQSPPNNWSLEAVKYYDELTVDTVDQELETLLQGMSYLGGFIFEKDVGFVGFLNRVRSEELELKSNGLWDVPHPWLNLFVPKSRIMDFNQGVFVDIIHKQNKTTGPLIVYPVHRNKWDDRMSTIIPNEDIFYSIALLFSSDNNNLKDYEDQNEEILKFCDDVGIKAKQYLPYYRSKKEWINHFGSKWETFEERKLQFDPKIILSTGQNIFTNIQK